MRLNIRCDSYCTNFFGTFHQLNRLRIFNVQTLPSRGSFNPAAAELHLYTANAVASKQKRLAQRSYPNRLKKQIDRACLVGKKF
jgi:hypothetical protein